MTVKNITNYRLALVKFILPLFILTLMGCTGTGLKDSRKPSPKNVKAKKERVKKQLAREQKLKSVGYMAETEAGFAAPPPSTADHDDFRSGKDDATGFNTEEYTRIRGK